MKTISAINISGHSVHIEREPEHVERTVKLLKESGYVIVKVS